MVSPPYSEGKGALHQQWEGCRPGTLLCSTGQEEWQELDLHGRN